MEDLESRMKKIQKVQRFVLWFGVVLLVLVVLFFLIKFL